MRTSDQPQWPKKRISWDPNIDFTKAVLAEFGIKTVCQSARCPNIFDCFSKKIATFLILGNVCTRSCAFCYVQKGRPVEPEEDEPGKVAEVAAMLGLTRIVITSVTRDDLADGGSAQFIRTTDAIRDRLGENIEIEVLVPDFRGEKAAIGRVVEAQPDIFGHNVETVPRLYQQIRAGADYQRSIKVLRTAKEIDPDLTTKSAIMLGFGETEEEIIAVMKDLRAVDCDMLAIGQYLRPSSGQVEVKKFIKPEEFLRFEEDGYSLGFKDVNSGVFVRSSYRV